MKTIGLLGGISWESTREYYRLLNEAARNDKGGLHSASLILHSFDFGEIAQHQTAGEWKTLDAKLGEAAKGLEAAGAKAMVICSNYMHRCAEAVAAACDIPLIHIADAVGEVIVQQGQNKVGLLGAAGTMELPFYREKLAAKGIEAIIPAAEDRAEINRVIFEELCRGEFSQSSRDRFLAIMDKLAAQGAQGMVLSCTEIEQLVRQEDTDVKLYPSAELHAKVAAQFMLRDDNDQVAA